MYLYIKINNILSTIDSIRIHSYVSNAFRLMQIDINLVDV